MQFNATFDANVSATARTAINNVLAFFANTFSDNVTVNVKFQFGATALGQSSFDLVSTSYDQIKSALQNDATSSNDSSAIASLPGSDPIGGAHSYFLTEAQVKALGLQAPDGTLDGTITLSNNTTFDFDRSNGISAGTWDFQGTVAHELSEVMGRGINSIGSNSPVGPANRYYVLDLFKYTGTGVHSFTGTTAGYYSPDNGATHLLAFNTNPNGDFGDWASTWSSTQASLQPRNGRSG